MAEHRDRNAYALDRVRQNAGALFIALNYTGGPGQLHRDLLVAENHADQLAERIGFAMAVLRGEADEHVLAWERRSYEVDDALCDHCKDLSARMLRAARDKAARERDRVREQLSRALLVARRGLGAALRPEEMYDEEALIRRLASFFGVEVGNHG